MAKRTAGGASTVSLKRSAARASDRFVLVIRHGDQFRLEQVATPEVVLGRDPGCTVVIDDESISRRHARLRFGPTIQIEDLGSRNGTFVGGRRLPRDEARGLEVGEAIALAEIQVFVDRAPRRPGAATSPRDGVIVRDPKMKQLYAVLEVIAASPLRVLVLGETGVGKDVFARTIHARSSRHAAPFLALNCGAFAESMLESELFGHEKGAFTGAVQAKPGLLEAAHGGTVFLDEVGELSASTQVKLLRVLEAGEVLRLGSVSPRRVDVRVVSATNRDLRARVAEGAFRQDLYYRLNGTTITLPPLRERRDDVGPLAEMFASAMAASLGRAAPALTAEALAVLEGYAWPGNVRELKNVIDRAVVMSQGKAIGAADLELEGRFEDAPAPRAVDAPASQGLWSDLELVERRRIVDALAAAGGNQSAAARRLGIARATLIKRIEQYGLARPKKR